METNWREELRERIRWIKQHGGPPPEGETVELHVRLSRSQFESFVSLLGQPNAEPFGEAPAGTLKLSMLHFGDDGKGALFFQFHPRPLAGSAPSRGPTKPGVSTSMGPRITAGVDFNTFLVPVFPLVRQELDAMREGKRAEALVPISKNATLAVGDWVTFVEGTADPFGVPVNTPGGVSLSVKLKRVRDENRAWAGQKLVSIAWDPDDVTGHADPSAEHPARGEDVRREDE